MQKGLNDKAIARIAKNLRKKTSQEDIGGNLPVVQSRDKYVSDTHTGAEWNYEKFVNNPDLDAIIGKPSLSSEELISYLEKLGVSLIDFVDEDEDLSKLSVNEIKNILNKENVGFRGTTYNWGWWGPTLSFTVVGPASEEPYEEGILFLSEGYGGGEHLAYKVDSYAEEAPWYSCTLIVDIKTDRGEIRLDSEGYEAYNFVVVEDTTNTWEESDEVSSDDLQKKLDWKTNNVYMW